MLQNHLTCLKTLSNENIQEEQRTKRFGTKANVQEQKNRLEETRSSSKDQTLSHSGTTPDHPRVTRPDTPTPYQGKLGPKRPREQTQAKTRSLGIFKAEYSGTGPDTPAPLEFQQQNQNQKRKSKTGLNDL